WWWGWLIGSAFSGVIEGVQGTVFTQTRFATLSDFITNTTGAGIGAGLALLIMVAFPPRADPDPIASVVRSARRAASRRISPRRRWPRRRAPRSAGDALRGHRRSGCDSDADTSGRPDWRTRGTRCRSDDADRPPRGGG